MNLTSMAIFAIIFLAILAIISNTGPSAITGIENNMFLMNCPSPTIHALPVVNATTGIQGFTVIYTLNYTDTHVNTVTVFNCTIDDITGNRQVSLIVYEPSEGFFSTFDNVFAWLGYIYSYVVSGIEKGGALLQVIASVLTPVNFDITGFGISDLSGISLMFIILLYATLYIVVGLWVYQSINPLGGGSGG